MPKIVSTFIFIALTAMFIVFASAQDRKSVESPRAAKSPSQELLGSWNYIGGKIIAMAEDFPEDKYSFKAQKDERTFGENLLHVALDYNEMMTAIKGSAVGFIGTEDSLRKKYPTKAEIVQYLKHAVVDGADLLKAEGDSGLTREFKYPWGNRMIHGSYGWMGCIEHAGEHYGQLVVYYRLNGMVPPSSRPKK
jgi:hypothetical protein